MNMVPRLFYLGLMSGVLIKIPSLDLGTVFYCLMLNRDVLTEKWKSILAMFGTIFFGYIISLFLPFYKLNYYFISYSQMILAFLSGAVFYSSFFHWNEEKANLNVRKFIFSIVVLILGIFVVWFLSFKFYLDNQFLNSFFSGFMALIPSFEYRSSNILYNSLLTHIFYTIGLIGSIIFLKCINKYVIRYKHIFSGVLLISLIDLWPWKTIAITSNMLGNSVRYVSIPCFPEDFNDSIVLLIFFIFGYMLSWAFHRIYEKNSRLIHDSKVLL